MIFFLDFNLILAVFRIHYINDIFAKKRKIDEKTYDSPNVLLSFFLAPIKNGQTKKHKTTSSNSGLDCQKRGKFFGFVFGRVSVIKK